jgi:hypothetical protein
MDKIPQTTKDLWLPLLRSPTTKQCTGHLYDGSGYCCLGVYAKAAGATFVPGIIEEEDDEGNTVETEADGFRAEIPEGGYVTNLNDNELLDQRWATLQGISKEHQELLSHLNDGGQIHLENTHPLYDVVALVAVHATPKAKYLPMTEVTPEAANVDGTMFTVEQHTFAQIADVIEKHL